MEKYLLYFIASFFPLLGIIFGFQAVKIQEMPWLGRKSQFVKGNISRVLGAITLLISLFIMANFFLKIISKLTLDK